jgi:hypothetical protein
MYIFFIISLRIEEASVLSSAGVAEKTLSRSPKRARSATAQISPSTSRKRHRNNVEEIAAHL